MIEYKISSSFNQKFVVSVYGDKYYITLRSFRGMTYCTITDDDGTTYAANVRCVNGHWLIPWKRYAAIGNFRFEGLPNNYIHPTDYESVKLVYYNQDEIEALDE